MTALEKELVEALEKLLPMADARSRDVGDGAGSAYDKALNTARSLLARAKQTGTHEYVVSDDGHGRAMVGGRRLCTRDCGIFIDDVNMPQAWKVNVGTRVRVELRDGCDFATLIEVLQ